MAGASERAYLALRDEIQGSTLPAGAVLAEADLAARLGVSRTPVRAALARLVAEGLVVQQSPRVTVVSDVSPREIRALFEVRRALEETSVRLAAERGDRAAFRSIAAEFARFAASAGPREAADLDAYYALIARFDATTDAAVGNAYLDQALRTVRTHLVRVRRLARDSPARLAASAAEHRLVAEAIGRGDGELAAHAMHTHLHHALTHILAAVETAAVRTGHDPDRLDQGAA